VELVPAGEAVFLYPSGIMVMDSLESVDKGEQVELGETTSAYLLRSFAQLAGIPVELVFICWQN
jgi:hypothetical protein